MIIDGNFSSPVFLGSKSSPAMEDGVTLQHEEMFVQARSAYRKKAPTHTSTRFPRAYLLEEREEERLPNDLLRFSLTYVDLPPARVEREEVSFTWPGKSGGVGINWEKYRLRKPITLPVLARVDIAYFFTLNPYVYPGEIPTPTVIKLGDEPVDFLGTAYQIDREEDGSDTVTFLGSTTPLVEPERYIVRGVYTRWRGNIWERRISSVSSEIP